MQATGAPWDLLPTLLQRGRGLFDVIVTGKLGTWQPLPTLDGETAPRGKRLLNIRRHGILVENRGLCCNELIHTG